MLALNPLAPLFEAARTGSSIRRRPARSTWRGASTGLLPAIAHLRRGLRAGGLALLPRGAHGSPSSSEPAARPPERPRHPPAQRALVDATAAQAAQHLLALQLLEVVAQAMSSRGSPRAPPAPRRQLDVAPAQQRPGLAVHRGSTATNSKARPQCSRTHQSDIGPSARPHPSPGRGAARSCLRGPRPTARRPAARSSSGPCRKPSGAPRAAAAGATRPARRRTGRSDG